MEILCNKILPLSLKVHGFPLSQVEGIKTQAVTLREQTHSILMIPSQATCIRTL